MRIEHVALWAKDLEAMKTFYTRYFGGMSGEKYTNAKKGFASYFVTFETGARLEIMHNAAVADIGREGKTLGWTHIAFGLGSKDAVDALTERLRADGYHVVGELRTTGDGYYESVVLDPEGNPVELTI